MNKKILLITAISMSILVSGCSSKQAKESVADNTKTQVEQSTSTENQANKNSEETYKIIENVYKSKAVTIKYPQITGLSDKNKQATLNELIKKGALEYVSKGVEDDLTLEIKYKITLTNKEVISIQYSGVEYFKGAAHPSSVFYTTNIDLVSAKPMKLSDIVTINLSLVEGFKKGKFIPWGYNDKDEISHEYKSNISEYVNGMDNKDLLEQFNKSDSKEKDINLPSTSCYLTENSIGISISASHAAGDHIEYEIKYNDIKNNLNTKNQVIKSLIDS